MGRACPLHKFSMKCLEHISVPANIKTQPLSLIQVPQINYCYVTIKDNFFLNFILDWSPDTAISTTPTAHFILLF